MAHGCLRQRNRNSFKQFPQIIILSYFIDIIFSLRFYREGVCAFQTQAIIH
jgi:hypothetical protein